MDFHFPHLTVEQTLNFAVASRTPRARLNKVSRKDYRDYVTHLLVTVFGLRHTTNTKVGNDYVRGVSGGERKRVSITEALAARAAVYCWDNATRGLDASTALEYSQAIRASTNFLGNVGIVAIYQAGENIYELFDKVTVLYAGRQVYFGPTEEAKAFFERMGYHCPARQTTAEFLTAVTDPHGRTAAEGIDRASLPDTADEFEAYWKASPEYAALLKDIDTYNASHSRDDTLGHFARDSKNQKMRFQRQKSRYMLTYPAQLRLAIKRGFQRVIGDKAFTIIHVCGAIAQSLIIGSLFYNMDNSTSAAFSRGGVLFFSLLYNALSALAEITNTFSYRPILLKQRSYSFYHPSVEALQHLLSEFPVKLLTYISFGLITYFLSNLNRTAGQFFFYLLIMTITSFAITAYFQMIAAWNTTSDKAQAFAGFSVLVIAMYAGVCISPSAIFKLEPSNNYLVYDSSSFNA